MFCTNCGKQLSDTARFCTGCGAPVKSAAQMPAEPVQEQAAAPAEPVREQASAEPMQVQSPFGTPEQQPYTAQEQPEAPFEQQQPAFGAETQAQAVQQPAFGAETQAQAVRQPQKKKKSKKGIVIGAACGGAALVGAGALTFTFAKAAVLRTFMGDQAYARSVMASYLDDALSDSKTYADIISKNADQFSSAYKSASGTISNLSSAKYYDAEAAASDASMTGDDNKSRIDGIINNDTGKEIAKIIYKTLETSKSMMPEGYTTTAGFTAEIGEGTYALLEGIESYDKIKPIVSDAVELINALSFTMSQGFGDTDYDAALSVNTNGSKLIGGVVKLTRNGELTIAFPGASNKAITAKIPSFEEAGVEVGADGSTKTYEIDYKKIGELYNKLKEAYFSRYDKAEIEFNDGSVDVSEWSENCTVITVTYNNDDIAQVFYSMADVIADDTYLPELFDNYGLPTSVISDAAKSLREAAQSLENSESKTYFKTESYVNGMNKPLGIKLTLGSRNTESEPQNLSFSCVGNDLNTRIQFNYGKKTMVDITCIKENAENGKIKIVTDVSSTRDTEAKKIGLVVDFSGVKKFKAFGNEMFAGKFTLSLDKSAFLEEQLTSKVGEQTLYEFLRDTRITAESEPSGDGFKSSFYVSSEKYGKIGGYMTSEPKAVIDAIPENCEKIAIDNIQDSGAAMTELAYDALSYVFGKVEEDATLSKLNKDFETVTGTSLLDSLSAEMKKLENQSQLGKHYAAYNSSTVYEVSDEARSLFNSTDTEKFVNGEPFTIRLWYDKDGNFSILDAAGEDEQMIKDMYGSAGLKSTYAEILSWKRRKGSYSSEPIGVTVVKTDDSSITAKLPDEYDFIDYKFDWDDYNIKDGYVAATSPTLYDDDGAEPEEGYLTSREGDEKFREAVAEYDAAAEKIYNGIASYMSSTGTKVDKTGDQYVVFRSGKDGKFDVSYSSNGSSEKWVNEIFTQDILGNENSITDMLTGLGVTTESLNDSEERFATVYWKNKVLKGVLYSDSSWGYYYFSPDDFTKGYPSDLEWSYIDGFYSGSSYGTYPKLGTKPVSAALSLSGDTGDTFTVYTMSSYVRDVVEAYAEDLVKDAGVELNVICSDAENYTDYVSKLYSVSDADIIVIDASYLGGFIDTSVTADELGITPSDMQEQYNFTHQAALNSSGDIAAFTWDNTAGMFMYRTDIAEKVLGTSNPNEVAEYVSTWDKFEETAEKMKAAGYYMYAGSDDTFRLFAQNTQGKLVDTSAGTVDEKLREWADMSKKHFDNGWYANAYMFEDDWYEQLGDDGKTFGFFFPYWGCDYIETTYEVNWNVCAAPADFFWSGEYLCVTGNSDNKALAAEVIKHLTCDTDTMVNIAKGLREPVNNGMAMAQLENDEEFIGLLNSQFGGENIVKTIINAAQELDLGTISRDYNDIYNYFTLYISPYIVGESDYDTALNEFFSQYADRQ